MFARGIYAIVDGDRLALTDQKALRPPVHVLRAYAQAALQAGAVAVQLRLKALPLGHPLRLTATNAIRRALGGRIPLIVDDDLRAAVDGHAGLHLGQTDSDPRLAQPQLQPTTLLGWSTHTLEQVKIAQDLPVDYLGFGPIRPTTGKQNPDATTGLTGLMQAVAVSRLPVVAIGGLTLADVRPVRETGAHAMAVIGAWLGPQGQPWPPAIAAEKLQKLVEAWDA